MDIVIGLIGIWPFLIYKGLRALKCLMNDKCLGDLMRIYDNLV